MNKNVTHIIRRAILISFIGILSSCSSILDKKYNEQTSEADIEVIKKEINGEDYFLLGVTLIRLSIEKDDPSQYTYGKILEMGKDYKQKMDNQEAEAALIAKKAEEEAKLRQEILSSIVEVTLITKGFQKISYQDYITFTLLITNVGDRDIRAVKGEVHFNDLFDEKIKKVSFTYDESIKSLDTNTYNASLDYNQFFEFPDNNTMYIKGIDACYTTRDDISAETYTIWKRQ